MCFYVHKLLNHNLMHLYKNSLSGSQLQRDHKCLNLGDACTSLEPNPVWQASEGNSC